MRDWLTLAECAGDVNVAVEIVRQWCIRWKKGEDGGLPYMHAGQLPEEQSKRVEYRVHREDWESFKRERRRLERREDRRVGRIVVEPLDLVGTRRAGAAARGR